MRWVLLLVGTVAFGCERRKSELETVYERKQQEIEAEREARIEELARKRREKSEAAANAPGPSDACKRLAKGTRDCNEGKPCAQVAAADMQACSAYLRANGLKENPFK